MTHATTVNRERVVFRTDASPTVGGGHVVRSLALAAAMTEKGGHCAFAVRHPTVDTIPGLMSSGHAVLQLSGHADSEPARLSKLFQGGTSWLIVDHYKWDAELERACRPWAQRILAIDDLANRPHDCDALLDQTLGREASDYRGLVSSDCRLLLGPHFALLRPQFAAIRAATLTRRSEAEAVRRILISFGTTDPKNLTAVALEGIKLTGLNIPVDVVLGRAAPYLSTIRNLVEKLPFPVTVHEQVSDMAAMLAKADLGIGAAGITSWERCCLGLPSLLIASAPNQRQIATSLEKAGAARVIKFSKKLDAAAVGRAILEICATPECLTQMGEAAARVCDGLGARRVVREIKR